MVDFHHPCPSVLYFPVPSLNLIFLNKNFLLLRLRENFMYFEYVSVYIYIFEKLWVNVAYVDRIHCKSESEILEGVVCNVSLSVWSSNSNGFLRFFSLLVLLRNN